MNNPLDLACAEEQEGRWLSVFRELPEDDQILLRSVFFDEIDDLAIHRGAPVADLIQRSKAVVESIREKFGMATPNLRPIAQSAILLPVSTLTISRFNPRKHRPQSRIEAIAGSIKTHGFDPSRALKVLETENGFEIFAGGTRWEAAKLLGYRELPCYLYQGLSPEEISREADLDNEFDASHEPVSLVDLWEEAHRLSQDEGWTHQQIAQAKGVGRTTVTERIKWWRISTPRLREAVRLGGLCESHVREITSVAVPEAISHWLTTAELVDHLVDTCLQGDLSTQGIRSVARRSGEAVARALSLWENLPPDRQTLYLEELRESNARSVAEVESAEQGAARRWAQQQSEEIAQIQERLEAEEMQVQQRAVRMLKAEGIRSRYIFGDFLDQSDPVPDWNLWLGFAPDLGDEWLIVFEAMLASAEPGAIVFLACPDWDTYRKVVAAAPATLTVRDPIVVTKPMVASPDPRRRPNSAYGLLFYGAFQDGRLGAPLSDLMALDRWQGPGLEPFWSPLIEAGSSSGQRVVDPFAQSGSVLRAAQALGRDYWGCEANPDDYALGVNSFLEVDLGAG